MTRTNFTILWFFSVDDMVKAGRIARLLSKVSLLLPSDACYCDVVQVLACATCELTSNGASIFRNVTN